MKSLAWLILILLTAAPVAAAVHTETVEYRQDSAVLEGYLAYDEASAGRRPAVLVVHEWKGITSYEKKRAEQLAALGYVAFVADIYGKGVRPVTNEEAGKVSGMYRSNRGLLRLRALAGLDVLKGFGRTDVGTDRGHRILFRGDDGTRAGAERRGRIGGSDFPRRARYAQPRGCQEHQGEGPGPYRCR